MTRVSAKTDRGNQVPKGGRLNRRRPGDGRALLETSEAGAVELMATPFRRPRLPAGSDVLGFPRRSADCHSSRPDRPSGSEGSP